MRLSLALVLLGVALPSAVAARPRAQVTFAAGKGGEAVAYFAPEVARTVTAALDAAGVDPASELAIAGHIDELPGERVRLTASVHGRTVSVEGSIENLDGVAAQLASQLVPLASDLPAAGARKNPHAPAAPRIAGGDAKSAAPVSAHKPAEGTPPSASTAPVAAAAGSTEKAAAPSPPPSSADPTTPSTTPASDPPSSTPAQSPAPSPAVVASAPPPPPSMAAGNAPQPSPYPGYRPPPTWGSAVPRPRVVAHVVPDSPSAFAGNGLSATQALFFFLGNRLRVTVVRGGLGFTAPQVAADEAWRAQARSVVMAHIEAVDYQQTPTGPGLRCRLEIVVVRDGRVVLRRVVESPPAPASPTGRRGRELDPMFMAVSQALEALASDLAIAVNDPR